MASSDLWEFRFRQTKLLLEFHDSQFTNYESPVTNHWSPVTRNLSQYHRWDKHRSPGELADKRLTGTLS
jgi:hypothetical protein